MTAQQTSTSRELLDVTDRAVEKALWFRSRDEDPDRLALWLEVTGVSQGRFTYDMYLDELAKAGPNDHVQQHGDLTLIVPVDSVDKLVGATVDRDGDLETGGIFVDNPNTPTVDIPVATVGELEGEVPDRIRQVLEEQINPAIRQHGGRADLAGFEDGVAYMQLSGGCQGCGMAAVTLQQGIERALTEAVPEVTAVRDVTDHASGTNPYYAPQGK